MLIYDTLEQARMRLTGSVITYRNAAFRVERVQADATGALFVDCWAYPIQRRGRSVAKLIRFSIDDQDLNFRIFKVGYMNDVQFKSAAFFSRATTRQQVQGLVPENLVTSGLRSDFAFQAQEFEDMLFGVYPTVGEAFDRLNNLGWSSVAISADFAVARDRDTPQLRQLLYRGRVVGIALGSKFKEFVVGSSNQYLTEVLTEAGFPFVVDDGD